MALAYHQIEVLFIIERKNNMGYFILSLLVFIVIIGFPIATFYKRSQYFVDVGLVWIALDFEE